MRNRRFGSILFGALLVLGCHKTNSVGRKRAHAEPRPSYENLSETGFQECFYDGSCTTIEILRFEPQYPLWSDGADKLRWAFIPPGEQVNTSDIDRWIFPVGTKFWKEFRIEGKKIETRYFEKKCDRDDIECWQYGSFHWNDDGTEATLVPDEGMNGVADIPGATYSDSGNQVKHDIPPRVDCLDCHQRGGDPILGFDVLQLSPDRDEQASHAKNPLEPGYVTLKELIDNKLLSDPPSSDPWPRIQAEGVARTAMGYLHGNCGSCHNEDKRGSIAPFVAFDDGPHFRHVSSARSIEQEACYRQIVNRFASAFMADNKRKYVSRNAKYPGSDKENPGLFDVPPYDDPELQALFPRNDSYRIRGGSAKGSAVVFRMQIRREFSENRQQRWGNYKYDSSNSDDTSSYTGAFAEHPVEDNFQMPYIGTNVPDEEGIKVISEWINSLPPPDPAALNNPSACPCRDSKQPYCINGTCSDKCNTNRDCTDHNDGAYCLNDGVCENSCGADDNCRDPETRSCVIPAGNERGTCEVVGPPPPPRD